MSENKNEKQVSMKDQLLEAIKSDLATSVKVIRVNSIDKEIGFREVSVKEQKTLSRVMMENDNRKDVAYDAQCALINEVCLDKTFDIYQHSEFDRIKLLIALYQANIAKNQVKFKCKNCGTENQYQLDFSNTLAKLDQIDLKPVEFKYSNSTHDYTFTIEYPSVKTVSAFHKAYVQKTRGATKIFQKKSMESMSNMEYINLFIKEIDMANKSAGTSKHITMSDYAVSDIEDIVSVFPQDVLYSDNGVLTYIINEFVKKINDSFDQQKCYHCGEVYDEAVNGAQSFL